MESIHSISSRILYLQNEIEKKKQFVESIPPGKIFSRQDAYGIYRYFKGMKVDGDFREIYLGKGSSDEIKVLAKKRIAELEIKDMQEELKRLKTVQKIRQQQSHVSHYLENHPGIAAVLKEDIDADANWGQIWKNQRYNRNFKYQEELKFSTVVPGLLVRSKSESVILGRLEHFNVPYHYDEIETVNGMQLAIDFTCMNVRTRRKWYWDHRGMLDDPVYIKKTLYCERQFLNGEIIPWVNMIVTAETKDHPLDMQWVDHLIQYYLL